MTISMHTDISFDIRPNTSPVTQAERDRLLAAPVFGQVFTDHMVTIRWTAEDSWHDARVEPYGPLTLDPSSAIFHYAQEVFEGLKAYRRPDGTTGVFRPRANAERFNSSLRRMAMPELPEDIFVRSLELLVEADRAWVPATADHSLYLRPFMIATQRGIGINRPSHSFLFMVIASPAGPYFPSGIKPVTVWLSEDYTRAAPGGTGATKCGGNYAAGFAGQLQALDHGCDQVIWLDAAEHRWVEEMGGMNIFFVFGSGADARIITPPLSGTLLPGVTRDSLLKLAPDLGIKADEQAISIDQWRDACASGELTEVFACGTAAAITPVGAVKGTGGGWSIGTGEPGPVTMRLREELLGIQFGTHPDPYNWVHHL